MSKPELINIAKRLARGALYSVITALIVIIGDMNVPAQRAFMLPIIATILTNLSYTVKKFMTNTVEIIPESIPEVIEPKVYGDPITKPLV